MPVLCLFKTQVQCLSVPFIALSHCISKPNRVPPILGRLLRGLQFRLPVASNCSCSCWVAQAGEELSFDYCRACVAGEDEAAKQQRQPCLCGAVVCKKFF